MAGDGLRVIGGRRRLADFAAPDSDGVYRVQGVTFENCEIVGPTVAFIGPDVFFSYAAMVKVDTLEASASAWKYGFVLLEQVHFDRCSLDGITLAGENVEGELRPFLVG